jgi:hypothetical protein
MTSTIKVNNIQNQCGQNIINENANTITLGASGDTIALASGASQTGFGRTGTVDWQTTPKTGTFTAVSGEGYFADTTSTGFTMNLPAGSAGDIVSVMDYAGTWQDNNLTIAPNGSDKIGGLSLSVQLEVQGQSVTFVYVDTTQGWLNTMDSTSNVRAETFMSATVSGSCNTLATAPDCANTKIATFVNPGTFCVSAISSSAANNVVSYLVVAGGGGGGSGCAGGGGGAGGFREVQSPTTPYIASPLNGYASAPNRVTVTASPYTITVGGGGPGASLNSGSDGTVGNDSVFSITSAGGGYGAGACSTGGAGGSGGGAGHYNPPGTGGGAGNTPPTTPAQGTDGGDNNSPNGQGPGDTGGGGGGAGGAALSNPCTPAQGGPGAPTEIITATYGTPTPTSARGFASGGGSGTRDRGCGATPNQAGPNPNSPPNGGLEGGGGSGGYGPYPSPSAQATGQAGTANTGGGGGGGSRYGPGPSRGGGGQGGSGIVIIRYKFQ